MRENSRRATLADDTAAMRKASALPNLLGENRLLAGLPAAEYRRLKPHLERVSLRVREALYEPERPIDYAYFPVSGVVSVVVDMQGGGAAEIGTIGNEGMLGVELVHGETQSRFRSFAQVSGAGLRMKAKTFRKEMESLGPMHRRAVLHAQGWMSQVGQSTVCNVRHSIEQRLCRWLLMTRDRVGAEEFPLTHEFIGQMLGVRRPSVTVVAGMLQREGLISYHRGVITIRDGRRLEQSACECYEVVKQEYLRLLGPAAG